VLTAAENQRLTEVGPGTPMGNLARRFWAPVCTSAQLPEPDCPPLRTELLGEWFVVFRDSDGRPGMLDDGCMHRGVSLALGRVEEGGIRCLYHGWKFSVDGTILDTPNHCSEKFRLRMKAPAYPVREAGGLIWAYIGPKSKEPPFPEYGFMNGPDRNRAVIRFNIKASYLQQFEGGIDSSHVGILHSNQANPTWMTGEFTRVDAADNPGALAVADNAPVLEFEDTPFGFHYVAKRRGIPSQDGSPTHSIRVTPAFLPFGRVIPSPEFQYYNFEIPANDGATSTFIVVHGDSPVDRDRILEILGLDDPQVLDPESCELRLSWSNKFGQNRSAMEDSWSGLRGITAEDSTLALSMGPIVDRTKEHVVAADSAILHLRALLLESIDRNERGEEPLGLIQDYSQMQSLVDTTIAHGEAWQSYVSGNHHSGSTGTEAATR
jgi:phthalate 4,5-dioxygenase